MLTNDQRKRLEQIIDGAKHRQRLIEAAKLSETDPGEDITNLTSEERIERLFGNNKKDLKE